MKNTKLNNKEIPNEVFETIKKMDAVRKKHSSKSRDYEECN